MPIQYPNGSSSTSSSQNPSPTKSTARSQTSDAGASARVDLNRGAPLLDWSRRHARKRSALPSAVSAVSATVTSGASVSTSTGGVTSDSHDEVIDGHVGLTIGIGMDVGQRCADTHNGLSNQSCSSSPSSRAMESLSAKLPLSSGGTRRMSMAENRRMLTSRPTSMLSLRSGTGVRNNSLAEDRNGTLDLTATESQSESKLPQPEPKPEPDSGSPPVPALLVLPPPSPMPLLASSPLPQHSQLPQPSSPAIPPSSPSSSSPAPPLQSQPQPPSTILIPSSDTTLTPTPDTAQTPPPTPCATMAPPPNLDVTTTTTITMDEESVTEATASTSEAPTATSSTTESGTTTMTTTTTEGANWWRYLAWGSSTNETSSTTPVQVVHEPGPATAPEVQGQLPAPAQAQEEGQPLGQEPVGAQLEPPMLGAPDRDVADIVSPSVDVSRGTELGSDVGVDGVSGPSEVVRDIGEVGVGHDVGRNVDAEVKADTDTSASMGTATGTNTDEKPAAVPSPGIGAWYTPWWRSRGGDTNTIATTDTTTLGSDANTNNNTDLNTDTNTNSDAATSPDTNNNAVDANTQTAADAGSIITGSETLHTATATSTLGTDTLVVPASQPQPQSQSDAESSTATPSAVEQTEAQTPSQPEAPDSKPSSANVSGPTSQAGTSTTSWMALSFFSARALATRRIANSTDAGAGSGNGEGGTIRGQADGGETQEPGQAHGGTMEVMELDLDEGLDEVVGQGRDQGVNSSEAQAMDVDEVGRSPEKLSEVGDSLVATVAGPSSTTTTITTTVANPITPMPTATSSILSLARLLPQRQSSPVPVPIPSTPNSRSSTPISSTPPSSLPQGTPPSASKISVKPSTPKSSSKPKPTPKPKPKPNLVLPTWGDTFYTPPRSYVPPLPRPIRGLEPSPSEQEKEDKEKAGMGALTQLGNLKGRVVDSARRVLALGFGGGNTGGSDATSVAGSASGGVAGNIGTLGKVGGWVGTSLLGHEDQTHHHDGEQPREGGQEWRHSAYERALPRSWDLLEGRVPRDILQPSHVPDVMATLSTPQFKHDALPTHDELRAETLNNLPEVHDAFRGCSKVVVIGVHGWFPGAVMRTVLGEPTGTSAKFVSMGVQAIEAFQARANGKVVATHTSNIDDAREATNDGIPSLANDGTRASTNDSTPAHLNDITGPQDTTNSGITVTRIPLEGEGTINARVDRLYHTLLTTPAYLAALHDADAVLIVAHSQGSVVATHILDRLVRDGHLWTGVDAGTSSEDQGDAVVQGGVGVAASDTGMGRSSPNSTPTSTWNRKSTRDRKPQRICCLAMCGVHLGPLRYLSTSSLLQPYIQYFESTAARELFEFQNTESQISKEYLSALNNVLDHRIKMVYVASLNDQVVGLYSGLFTAVSHPLILRALYIDGDAYQSSDFLSNLLVLLLRIRNAGISDSGLIAHLSEATAGSLNGVGHSTAYEEIATYALAVDYLFRADDGSAFDSTELVEMVIEQFDALSEQNDYEIPWALRDLIANEGVVRLFADEFMRLRDAFRDWHPKTAILRDVKRKLQPIQRLSSTILTTNTPRPNANSISKL